MWYGVMEYVVRCGCLPSKGGGLTDIATSFFITLPMADVRGDGSKLDDAKAMSGRAKLIHP